MTPKKQSTATRRLVQAPGVLGYSIFTAAVCLLIQRHGKSHHRPPFPGHGIDPSQETVAKLAGYLSG